MKNISLFFISLLVSIALSSCSEERSVEIPRGKLRVTENQDGIEVTSSDGTLQIKGNQQRGRIMIKTEDGEDILVDYNSGKLAPDFPPDMPVYPGSSIVMNQVFQNGRSAIATLSSKDTAANIVTFYEEQIPLKGWEPGRRLDLDNIVMLKGTRGPATFNVSITTEKDMIKINMARTETTN